MSMLKHILAVLLLPATVAIVIPAIILSRTKTMNVGWSLPFPFSLAPSLGGVVLIGLGLTLMLKTIKLFAVVGQGTLAPWAPPRRLVVQGIYRYVRNPMISGVLLVLAGEAILFGSTALVTWLGFFLLVNLIYIPFLEEPLLESRFGQNYLLYKANVPRWIPRLRPWDELSGDADE